MDFEDVYNEFDFKCRQLDLTEVYAPTSKSQYKRFLLMLQDNGVVCRGFMDDYNCKFEIRFR